MTPEDAAVDFALNRFKEIEVELARVHVSIRAADIFEVPQPADDRVYVRHDPKTRVGIVLAEGIPDLLRGQVVLDVNECYSYADLKTAAGAGPKLMKYSYQFSYMPELLIEGKFLRATGSTAQGHWGDLLLTQRRFFRYEGEDQDAWSKREAEYRNKHPAHHFHPGAGNIRLPVSAKPSVLSVACLVLLSFQYESWLQFAKNDADVLAATRVLVPDVQVV
jgi:hypothetical protein